MHIYLFLYSIHTCNSWTSWQLHAIMKQSDWRELQLRPFFVQAGAAIQESAPKLVKLE